MGAPTVDEIEDLTDSLAALIKAELSGQSAKLAGATNPSLANQVAALGDLSLISALGAYALDVDDRAAPANLHRALTRILADDALREFALRLSNYVKSSAGGGYASFRAYLADVGATLHPLAAELFRAALTDRDALTSAEDVTTVFAPNYQTIAPARVYVGADGSLSEETTDATDPGTADVTLFGSDNHTLYVRSPHVFSHLILGLSTLASEDVDWLIEYWNGGAYVELDVTDLTTGLTLAGYLSWTPPSDWARNAADKGGTAFADTTPMFTVRLQRRADTVNTPPVGTCLRIVPAAVLAADSLHLGVDQPPLGLILITGATTLVPESIVEIARTRFAEPGIRWRALTPGVDGTLTTSYVDQDSNNETQAQTALSAPAALDNGALTLAGADTGARSIRETGWAVTGGVRGVIEIYAVETRSPAL